MAGQWLHWLRPFDAIQAGAVTQEAPRLAALYIGAGLAEAIDRPRAGRGGRFSADRPEIDRAGSQTHAPSKPKGVSGGGSKSLAPPTVQRAVPHLRASAKLGTALTPPVPLPLLAGIPALSPIRSGGFPNV